MGFGSMWHWLLVLLVLVLLFGVGKISGLMGDLAKGIKSFKKEMATDESEAEPAPAPEPKAVEHKAIEHKPAKSVAKPKTAARAKAPRAPKAG
jgi:sec-independent protein translocase protein TatA